jgi:hypothetical protein
MVSISGSFMDPSGNPLAGGTILFKIQDTPVSESSGWVGNKPIWFTLTSEGELPSTYSVNNFIQSKTLGTLRNNFSGWVGMEISIGSSPVTVTGLGRICVSGNTGTHAVKLVLASNGQDVAGGSVTISMAGGTPGSFVYASLPSTVTLNANTAYYILSQETASGDQWYDYDTTITVSSVGTAPTCVYSSDSITFNTIGGPNDCYVPVDFQYSLGTPLELFAGLYYVTVFNPQNGVGWGPFLIQLSGTSFNFNSYTP